MIRLDLIQIIAAVCIFSEIIIDVQCGYITNAPSNITHLTGDNATFVCDITDKQEDEVFFWYKLPNAQGVPESPLMISYDELSRDESKYLVTSEYSLVIVEVAVEDEGQYQCSVANDAARAFLTVIDPPEMKIKLSGDSDIVSVSDVVNVTCEAMQAYPPVQLRWYKVTQDLTQNAVQSSTGPDSEGYGDTLSTIEVTVTKYDYLAYLLCVADTEQYEQVAVEQYNFDFGAATTHTIHWSCLLFAYLLYLILAFF